MVNIYQDFPVKAPSDRVFQAVSSPEGLDSWWTKRAIGEPSLGSEYQLWFGPRYQWRAVVTRCESDSEFELQLVEADDDWTGTHVGFLLEPRGDVAWVRFHHTGWPELNEHYRISNHCWAMYLRLLRKYVEDGESVPYDQRLDA